MTHLSINLIKHRLTRFTPPPEYDVLGEPGSLAAAKALFQQDAYQFQFWALGLIGAHPVGGVKKTSADRGIDGVRYFQDELRAGALVGKRLLVQVKGGHVKSGDIRDFVGTLAREGAEMGAFVTLEEPSAAMKSEAATAGMYTSPWDKRAYSKVQILTVANLLADANRPNPKYLQIPGRLAGPSATLPEPPKHKGRSARQQTLGFEAAE